MGVDKNSFSKELGLYPSHNSESHTNKWKHTQTSLNTLGTKLERLGSKVEASTKEHERQRRRLRPTGSTSTSDRVTLSLTEPHRVIEHKSLEQPTPFGSPGTSDWITWDNPENCREFAPNFRSKDLPNHLES
jgi:hypothetical protein